MDHGAFNKQTPKTQESIDLCSYYSETLDNADRMEGTFFQIQEILMYQMDLAVKIIRMCTVIVEKNTI